MKFCNFLYSVANIMFLETAITVEESAGFMTVCINISGGLPDTAIVRLSTVASTATGKLLSNWLHFNDVALHWLLVRQV